MVIRKTSLTVSIIVVFVASLCMSSISVGAKKDIDDLQAQIDVATADISTNAGDISTNTGAIGTNAGDIADVQSQIDNIEQTPWTDNETNLSTDVSIQIGDETIICDPSTAGTIRWTGTDFEGCNGTAWVSLTTPGPHTHHYAIGDTGPAGGIVFYITDGGLHGLEAAPADQSSSSGAEWGCYGTEIDGADGTAVGTGAQNTADILDDCTESQIAAGIADAYTLNGYEDWFLPSKDELNALYLQKDVVGGFANGIIFLFWSSSEIASSHAWHQDFSDGRQDGSPKNWPLRVRAVRAF